MQRINWFPYPDINDSKAFWPGSLAQTDFPTINGRKWLRCTVTATGEAYSQYSMDGDMVPPAGGYHAHARVYAQSGSGIFRIYTYADGKYTVVVEAAVDDGKTIDVDRAFTIPAGCTQVLVRIMPANKVGAKALMSDLLVESRTTYDSAVGGGASGLLLGRHHAARLTLLGVAA